MDEYFQRWVYSPDQETNAYWNEYLTAHPSQRQAVEEARAFLENIGSRESTHGEDVPDTAIQAIKVNFNKAIDRHESEAARKWDASLRDTKDRSIKFSYLAAATIFLAALLIGAIFLQRRSEPNLLQVLTLQEQETPHGELRHFELSDGTQVWLNASSTLRHPADFSNAESREVYLEGEAFFDVAENKEKPFVVRTAGVSIKVTGTTFNVKSYAVDHFVETALVTGEVAIASDRNDAMSVTLQPNQRALFRKDSGNIELKEVANINDLTEWRNGWMIFDDQPFSDIRQTLERWYGVTILVEDENSLSCTFSGKFKDKTLQEVLEIFCHTVPIRYRIEGSNVLIQGRLCKY